MANVTYHISASRIGDALGDSSYIIYQGECGIGANIVAQPTKTELEQGISISVDESVSKIYLVPLITEGLSNDCILGCYNEWSELELSKYVPVSPSPTPTVTVTPTSSIPASGPAPVSPTPTPSTSPANSYQVFNLDQIASKTAIDQVMIKVTGPVWSRPYVAGQIATWAAGGVNVPQSNDPNAPNYPVSLGRSFDIFSEGETFITRITDDFDARVYWYDDGTYSYVYFDNITLSQGFTYISTASNLKYLEI